MSTLMAASISPHPLSRVGRIRTTALGTAPLTKESQNAGSTTAQEEDRLQSM